MNEASDAGVFQGRLINYYLHADGHVISAFPVLPNFP